MEKVEEKVSLRWRQRANAQNDKEEDKLQDEVLISRSEESRCSSVDFIPPDKREFYRENHTEFQSVNKNILAKLTSHRWLHYCRLVCKSTVRPPVISYWT